MTKTKYSGLFLITGLLMGGFGYNLLNDVGDLTSTQYTWYWGFGFTLLAGMILGKWVADYIENKK